MSNNKAPWKDSISTEPINYAPKLLHKKIALPLNKALVTKTETDTGTRYLYLPRNQGRKDHQIKRTSDQLKSNFHLPKIFVLFAFNESSLKMMKNVFISS